jgi:hypothetical protein
MNKIACVNAGKIGDDIYCLPTVKELCKRHNCKADFITDAYCVPVKLFFEYQSYINEVRFGNDLNNYIDGKKEYEAVYQLGFRSFPDCSLPEYIAFEAGLPKEIGQHIFYELPEFNKTEPFFVVAPKGCLHPLETESEVHRWMWSLLPEFQRLQQISPIKVIILDYKNNMLDMASTIVNSDGFVGFASSPLTLAEGADMPKVICGDPYKTHLLNKGTLYYPGMNIKAEDILKFLLENQK